MPVHFVVNAPRGYRLITQGEPVLNGDVYCDRQKRTFTVGEGATDIKAGQVWDAEKMKLNPIRKLEPR